MRRYAHVLVLAALGILLCSLPVLAQEGDDAEARPVYMPIVNVQQPGLLVQGALTLDEQPLGNVTVQLEPCETGVFDVVPNYAAATDVNGAYLFVLPELAANLAGSYALHYDASAQPLAQTAALSSTLASFQTHCFAIDQGVGGVASLDMPTLNIAAPVFISSEEDAPQPMPVTFVWAGREINAPNEHYQWQADVQFDCGNCEPVHIEADPIDVHDETYMPQLTWTCIYRHGEGSGDVLGIDYWLEVVNDIGVGVTAIEYTAISTTVHECP